MMVFSVRSAGVRTLTRLLLLLPALLLLRSSTASAQGPWVITDIGTLGGLTSFANDINEAGQVVGSSQTASGQTHAFIWTLATGMIDLGTLGGTTSGAAAINNAGQVVGSSTTAAGQSRAFLWSPTTGMVDLGTLGGTSSFAADINDSGVVCGTSTNASGASRAFMWTASGGMVDLGSLGGAFGSSASAINAAGWIAGGSSSAQYSNWPHAFLWKPATGMVDIGWLGSASTEGGAFGINSSGQVVGYIEHAFVISGNAAFSWTAATGMRWVATLGGAENTANAVNDSGLIVGSSFITGNLISHAFAGMLGSTIFDLGTLGGTTSSAQGVNNAGVIVGSARTATGASHAVVWRPPAPTITIQPLSQVVTAGFSAVFTAAAAGTPTPTVQWQVSTNGGTTFTNISGATSGTYSIVVALADSGKQFRAVFTNSAGTATTLAATLTATTLPTMSLDRTRLLFAATASGNAFVQQTPEQQVRLLQQGAGTVTWTVASNQPWLTVSPASGSGSAILTIGVSFANGLPPSGNATGFITFTLTGAGGSVGPITVILRTLAATGTTAPIGTIDTPIEGVTGVTGSIPVTGWAIDDVEVRTVRIMRDSVAGEGPGQVFIGNAVFVEGARPDIARAYAGTPRSSRAGWGYLMLTNFLPNQGNGTFKLYAYADDADGHTSLLGTRTITCANNNSTKPFGAIDTPAQGEAISGVFANYGWVLAQGKTLAYPPFGTVSLVVDGAFGPSPGGWVSRSDLTTLFPKSSYDGVDNALGVLNLDTTTLANGVHTIAWVVTANNGQTDGIGSRYFTVANGSSLHADAPGPAVSPAGIASMPLDTAPVRGRRGYDVTTPLQPYTVDASGRIALAAEELDRIELHLGEGVHQGYLRVGDGLAPLPIGSHLDPATGAFTWQPGVGFVHDYDLVFLRCDSRRQAVDDVSAGTCRRREVRITLHPKGSNRVGAQITIDTPLPDSMASQPILLAGWAIDLDGSVGTGVDTVHVWAYPVSGCGGGCEPQFVGAASYGGSRPDVGAVFGERFAGSGFGMVVDGLAPGTYDLAVFAWSTAKGGFVPARVVRVVTR
jgi:probable HAF family extracellular repeat protein